MTAAVSTHLVIADDHPLFRDALRQAVASVVPSAKIDERAIAKRLYDPDMPDPELMVRTILETDRKGAKALVVPPEAKPSGELHIGNYLGAVKNWVELQRSYESFFCVVDYHAITIPYEPDDLRTRRREMMVSLLASGLEPDSLPLDEIAPYLRKVGDRFGVVARQAKIRLD